MLLAEAWLDEADDATVREQELLRELAVLRDERLEALAAVEAEAARADVPDGPSPEEERQARLDEARAGGTLADAAAPHHVEAEARSRRHRGAGRRRGGGTARGAEAADAEAAVAEAIERADRLAADLVRIAEELQRPTARGRRQRAPPVALRSRVRLARGTRLELAEAEAAFAAADDRPARHCRALGPGGGAIRGAGARSTPFRTWPTRRRSSIAEEIEWYLLARLAAQRAVCLGGSLPLLLDDALEGLDEDQLGHVLGRLERMADAVQVIVVSDDPLAASWALMAGQDRAAVIHQQPA